ncbi:hypothetical protein diail_9167 [Diaporthe ilicicola]|nr:hypothetical protein diail_9167 [Diaporthe ilicicola]
MAKEKKVASDFQKLITEGAPLSHARPRRERKQAQDLAAKVFRRDRVSSAPPKFNGTGGSLASRAGIKKNALLQAEHDSTVAAQVNLVNSSRHNNASLGGRRRGGGLQQVAARPAPQPLDAGITIRGLAGPFVVIAQNLAPGTTAGDLESAMMPVGGLVSKCRIIKTHPIVIAEIEFQTKEGADRVIERFNNQLTRHDADISSQADGRVLHVYAKIGGPPTSPVRAPRAPRAPASQGNGVLIDGSLGFEPMQVEDSSNTGLYSDDLVGSTNTQSYNRRGRGFRGGRGGNNR